MGNQVNLSDAQVVSKGALVFVAIGGVLVLVANTPGYPIALGVVIIALLYVLLDSKVTDALGALTGVGKAAVARPEKV